MLLLIVIGGYSLYKSIYKYGYESGYASSEMQYNKIPLRFEEKKDSIVPEFTFIEKIKPVNKELLWQEAKKYWAEKYKDSVRFITLEKKIFIEKEYEGDYIAEFNEKTENYELYGEFVSPIPLHPMSYFNYNFNYKKNEIIKSETNVEFDYPAFWISAGMFTIVREEIESFGTMGVSFNLLNKKHFNINFHNGIIYDFGGKKFNSWRSGFDMRVGI